MAWPHQRQLFPVTEQRHALRASRPLRAGAFSHQLIDEICTDEDRSKFDYDSLLPQWYAIKAIRDLAAFNL